MAGIHLNADLHVRPGTYMTAQSKNGCHTLSVQDDPFGGELTLFFQDVVKVREMANALNSLADQMAATRRDVA